MHSLISLTVVLTLNLVHSRGSYKEPYPWLVSKGSHHLWSVNRQPAFYACFSPKVACSEWLKYIHKQMLPADKVPQGLKIYARTKFLQYNLNRRDQSSQADYYATKAIAQDPNVYKFAVVRHPWDRLNSAFRSKYEGACNYSKACLAVEYQLEEVLKYPNKLLTFHQFVAAISRTPTLKLNPHFRPQTLLCELTTFPYDALVDLKNHTQLDQASDRCGFSMRFTEMSRPASTGARYYGGRTHKEHACTAATVRLAEAVYGVDAAVLGYSFSEAYDHCREHGVSSWSPSHHEV
eukprot:TRINITY_DN9888_c2_g1_i1.p1 TRINITY_DN9888_c2_g1~~TRINITY_DN9888_c2_g1_i1.p1  ORF type:complete len:292 (+),score=4.65 TRINITY_DN9888_c2_g1_i1:68-943(+)